MRIFKIIAILLLLSNHALAGEEIPKWQSQFVSSSIQSAVIHICAEQRGLSTEPMQQNFIGLMHALALIDTPESLQALVDLSDYYLGSAAGEDLTALVTNRGSTIKQYLVAKKKTEPSCHHKELCLSKQKRNQRIDVWISLIEKGVKVKLIH